LDAGLTCPVTLYRSATGSVQQRAGVILSHDREQCMDDVSVVSLARKLAGDDCLVIVPEHASTNQTGLRRLTPGGNPDVANRLMDYYAAGDTVGLPPLALRVWDDRRCVEHLVSRPDVDAKRLFIVGIGLGGLDAGICAAVDERLSGAACVGVITSQDWACEVAPKLDVFSEMMPYLPGLLAQTQLQYVYAAVAPKPLLLVDHKDHARWPVAGFKRASDAVRTAYELSDAPRALTVGVGPSAGEAEIRAWLRSACTQKKSL
jgi:dienelactone hydrolase